MIFTIPHIRIPWPKIDPKHIVNGPNLFIECLRKHNIRITEVRVEKPETPSDELV